MPALLAAAVCPRAASGPVLFWLCGLHCILQGHTREKNPSLSWAATPGSEENPAETTELGNQDLWGNLHTLIILHPPHAASARNQEGLAAESESSLWPSQLLPVPADTVPSAAITQRQGNSSGKSPTPQSTCGLCYFARCEICIGNCQRMMFLEDRSLGYPIVMAGLVMTVQGDPESKAGEEGWF